MATKQVLNPKYQMGWGELFSTVKSKLNAGAEAGKSQELKEKPKPEEAEENKIEEELPLDDFKAEFEPADDDLEEALETDNVEEAEDKLEDTLEGEVFFSDADETDEPVDETDEPVDETDEPAEEAEEFENLSESNPNEEITTFREAQDYMKTTFGLAHKDVISREKLLEQMEAHNVVFPNLSL